MIVRWWEWGMRGRSVSGRERSGIFGGGVCGFPRTFRRGGMGGLGDDEGGMVGCWVFMFFWGMGFWMGHVYV
jgi:hypothetical protein